MSDNECDYMSDNFLAQSVSTHEDIRPGLLKSRSEKRQNELAKKKVESDKLNTVKNKSIKVLEKEKLELGLQTPINNSNKGYAMLERMGFKSGSTLGKTGRGLTEPISVPTLRNFREGLGVKAALVEMREKKKRTRAEAKAAEPSLQDFRARMSEEVNEREAGIDLFKSQKTCYSLDSAKDLDQNPPSQEKAKTNNLGVLATRKGHTVSRELKRKHRRNKAKLHKIYNNGNLELAIVPNNYPAIVLSKEESERLHASLTGDIFKDVPGPQFDCFVYLEQFEASFVKCHDLHSKIWCYSNISKIKSIRNGLQLCVKEADAVSNGYRIHEFYMKEGELKKNEMQCVKETDTTSNGYRTIGFFREGGAMNENKLLKRLAVQNPELNVSGWSYSSTIFKRKHCFVKLRIPESDVKILESLGNQMYFEFSRVRVSLIDDKEDTPNTIPLSLMASYYFNRPPRTFIPPILPDSEEDEADIKEWYKNMTSFLPLLRYSTTSTAQK